MFVCCCGGCYSQFTWHSLGLWLVLKVDTNTWRQKNMEGDRVRVLKESAKKETHDKGRHLKKCIAKMSSYTFFILIPHFHLGTALVIF